MRVSLIRIAATVVVLSAILFAVAAVLIRQPTFGRARYEGRLHADAEALRQPEPMS